jgi:hypothetical protein
MKYLLFYITILAASVSLTKGDADSQKMTLIQKIVDGSLHAKLAEVTGIKNVIAPSYGFSVPVIPDILYRVNLRVGFKSDLDERTVIKNLESFVLREYFSPESVTTLAFESFSQVPRVSILYSEGDHLGEMTLFLIKKGASYELLVNLHVQIHPNLSKNRLKGIQIDDLLQRPTEK